MFSSRVLSKVPSSRVLDITVYVSSSRVLDITVYVSSSRVLDITVYVSSSRVENLKRRLYMCPPVVLKI